MVKLFKKTNLQNHNTSMSTAMTLHDLFSRKTRHFFAGVTIVAITM